MASSASPQTYGNHRQDLQAAIAKAVELRALHAALLQGTSGSSPANPRLPPGSSQSLSRISTHFTPEDYPVFTPSYEEESLPECHFIHPDKRSMSENWSGIGLDREGKDDELVNQDDKSLGFPPLDGELNFCSPNDHFSNRAPSINQMSIFAPGESNHMNLKNANRTMPPTNTQSLSPLPSKNRRPLSWLFTKLKKKPKSEMSPNTMVSEDMSQLIKEWGVFSLESLKKELLEATESREAAVAEVTEMRSSLGELKQKLVSLESYCEELKKALKQAAQGRDSPNLSKRTKSISTSRENHTMPVSHEVMVEGFLQIVSEARLSVKHFCKTLVNQVEEADSDLMEKLNLLLHPHQITLSNKNSKGVIYHLEALINQCLYQEFENCVFQKNGARKVLDPRKERLESFSAFVALRNLSWSEVLRKGTKYYSEDFSKFCDQKMNCIVNVLNWSRPWPEQLLQSFFVSAKCIWLLHLLAFSFSPPLVILRVEEDMGFDPLYMDDILLDRRKTGVPARVKIMVMPGFYVEDKVLKCRVLCRHTELDDQTGPVLLDS